MASSVDQKLMAQACTPYFIPIHLAMATTAIKGRCSCCAINFSKVRIDTNEFCKSRDHDKVLSVADAQTQSNLSTIG